MTRHTLSCAAIIHSPAAPSPTTHGIILSSTDANLPRASVVNVSQLARSIAIA